MGGLLLGRGVPAAAVPHNNLHPRTTTHVSQFPRCPENPVDPYAQARPGTEPPVHVSSDHPSARRLCCSEDARVRGRWGANVLGIP
jgi:hypothetical protein